MKADRIRAGMAGEAGPQLRRFTLAKRASRAAARGVTVVEVLILFAVIAILAFVVRELVFPCPKKSPVKQAALTCGEIRKTAQSYVELDMEGNMDRCPTVQELVNAKKLEKVKANDPWGTPFKLGCSDGEVTVTSAGEDREFDSPDDVKHNFTRADVERVDNL